MVFLGLRFKGLLGGAVISYTSCNEVAGLIFGKRAIFYYPPGCFIVLLFGLVARF